MRKFQIGHQDVPQVFRNQGELRSCVIKKLHDIANRTSIYQNLLNSSFQQNFEFLKSVQYYQS